VDPVLLQIPTYHDVIPKKDARDLRTIRTKLDTDKHDSIDAWEADIDLMVRNAITFNGADSEVGQIAAHLQARARELVAGVRAAASVGQQTQPAGKKRAGTGTPGASVGAGVQMPTSKKLKLN